MKVLILIAVGIPISMAAFQAPAATPPVRPALTETQKQMLKAAETDLNSKMASLTEPVSRAAKALNRALLADKADPELRGKLADDLAKRVSELVAEAIRMRALALGAIIDSLSPEQKSLLLAESEKPGADADLLNVMKKVFEENRK